MKNTILHHSDKWFGVFTDTTEPTQPHDSVPPPVPDFGTAPPVNTGFGQTATLHI